MSRLFKHLLVTLFAYGTLGAVGFPEYYYEIADRKDQKREFINILKPLLDKSNQKIMMERSFIEQFFQSAMNSAFRNLNPNDLKYLLSLAKKYKVKALFDRDEFLKRIDVIPIPLGIAQGAIESGWGKSRFVRLANNVFGHWTWGEVGIIPEGREEGKNHKIRIFNSLQASVDAYTLNLNRHYAYRDFRNVRWQKKKEGKVFTGFDAAKTMLYYSELRERYVKMLENMMKENRLLYYDSESKKGSFESRSGKL